MGHYWRKNIRLPGWDYASNCCYHVTLCTRARQLLFGTVVPSDGFEPAHVALSPLGNCCDSVLQRLAEDESRVKLFTYSIMPNHVHLLVWVRSDMEAPISLPNVVRYVKSSVTREARKLGFTQEVWQKSYYETAIRNDQQLESAWQYIADNPAKWAEDKYYCE